MYSTTNIITMELAQTFMRRTSGCKNEWIWNLEGVYKLPSAIFSFFTVCCECPSRPRNFTVITSVKRKRMRGKLVELILMKLNKKSLQN